jgi:hypothetical protein
MSGIPQEVFERTWVEILNIPWPQLVN